MGVDVSKAVLDIFYQGEHRCIDQNQKGYEIIAQWIGEYKDATVIVCEASGGYERPFINAMLKQGIRCHIAQANKVRAFARAIGRLAKTDKIDAKIITNYAEAMTLKSQAFSCESTQKIKALIKRRDQLLLAKQAEKQRLDKVSGSIAQSIHDHIQWLNDAINNIEKELAKQTAQSTVHNDKYERYCSVPGVGTLTAQALIAFLPELGKANDKEIAALAGVAPFNRDSGGTTGKRYTWGGRSELRKILYMAALSCMRTNRDLRLFYQRLKAKNKPGKVALVAVIRKLLCLLNSLEKRKANWVDIYNKS